MPRHVLKMLGLTESEVKVYLICLALGQALVSTIASRCGFKRTSTYTIIEKLVKKGFLSSFKKNGTNYFCAIAPEVLLEKCEQQVTQSNSMLKKMQQILPILCSLNEEAKSTLDISIYEGRKGLITGYEDTLTSSSGIIAIASIDDTETYFPKYVPEYYKRRTKAGINISAIFPDSNKSRFRQEQDQFELRKSRLINSDLMKHTELNVYDDKTAYFSFTDEAAIIVRSKALSDSLRDMFSLCWDRAGTYENSLKKAEIDEESLDF